MPHDYDILIVGAGPAGCAAAYDLAHAGKRVLLLDKRAFPRPKACACGLTRKTLKALRYSVDPVIERVCHEIVLQSANAVAAEPGSLRPPRTEVRVKTRNPICAMAVRERFDEFCLNQTLASGRNGGSVELRKIEGIVSLREDMDTVELDIAAITGAETLRAPALIGADGSNGQTRRLASTLHVEPKHDPNLSSQPESTSFDPNLSSRPESASLADAVERPAGQLSTSTKLFSEPAWYTSGFALEATVAYADLPATLPGGGTPHDLVFDFAPLPGGYGWLFPKGDHINIGVGAFAPATNASRTQIQQVTRTLLIDYAQRKLGMATLAHITGQQLGMGGHDYVPRGRVLLVGDAAGLVDPLTGEGIHSAIVSGQAAATAILSCAKSCVDGESSPLANLYARNLRPLQQTLAFSHRAARAFYAEPERGFKAMRLPILRSLILKTYADGVPHTRLITTLAKLVA